MLALVAHAAAAAADDGRSVVEAPATEIRPWSGQRKPGLNLAGAATDLSAFRGRPVLVHFFATWCEPCRPETGALARLSQQPHMADVAIVAISVAEPDGRVRRFFEALPVPFPILLDRDRTAAKSWGVALLPTTFFLDADLTPRFVVERDLAWDQIDLSETLRVLPAATARGPAPQPYPTATRQGGS